MNQGLKAQIHRYAEDREIDYMSAKNLGNAYGLNIEEICEAKALVCPVCGAAVKSPGKLCPVCSKTHTVVKEDYELSSFADEETDEMYGGYENKRKKRKSY